ncbi:putative Heterokaryon incompatibility domain-containing protein [Seiridium cardinale]
MLEHYDRAKVTVMHDQELVNFPWKDDGSLAVALILSVCFSRGWTAAELWASRNHPVKVLFADPKNPSSDTLIKHLDDDILAADLTLCLASGREDLDPSTRQRRMLNLSSLEGGQYKSERSSRIIFGSGTANTRAPFPCLTFDSTSVAVDRIWRARGDRSGTMWSLSARSNLSTVQEFTLPDRQLVYIYGSKDYPSKFKGTYKPTKEPFTHLQSALVFDVEIPHNSIQESFCLSLAKIIEGSGSNLASAIMIIGVRGL